MRNGKKLLFLTLIFSILVGISGRTHEWTAPREAALLKNPLADDATIIAHGKGLYLENCASCHGESVEGLGTDETGFSKTTPNLKSSLKMHNEGDLFWKIQEGKNDMPSFKEDLTKEEIWAIIRFIESKE